MAASRCKARARRGTAASHPRCLPHDPCRCRHPFCESSCMFALRLLLFILQLVGGGSFPTILRTKLTRSTHATSKQLSAPTLLTSKRLALTGSRFVLGRSRLLLSALSDDHQKAHGGRPRRFSLLHFVRSMRNTCSDRTLNQRVIELLRDLFCLLFWAGGWSIITRLGWDSTPRKSLICLLVGAAGLWMT